MGWAGHSELHFAGREGLLLHGHCAVAAQHSDQQLPLAVMGFLVPLMHGQRIKRWNESHLRTRKIPWPIREKLLETEANHTLFCTDLNLRPVALPLQQCVQDASHGLLLYWVISTDNVMRRAKTFEELCIHSGGSTARRQVGQVHIHCRTFRTFRRCSFGSLEKTPRIRLKLFYGKQTLWKTI